MFWFFLCYILLLFDLLICSFNKIYIDIYYLLIMMVTFIEYLLSAWHCYCFIGIYLILTTVASTFNIPVLQMKKIAQRLSNMLEAT